MWNNDHKKVSAKKKIRKGKRKWKIKRRFKREYYKKQDGKAFFAINEKSVFILDVMGWKIGLSVKENLGLNGHLSSMFSRFFRFYFMSRLTSLLIFNDSGERCQGVKGDWNGENYIEIFIILKKKWQGLLPHILFIPLIKNDDERNLENLIIYHALMIILKTVKKSIMNFLSRIISETLNFMLLCFTRKYSIKNLSKLFQRKSQSDLKFMRDFDLWEISDDLILSSKFFLELLKIPVFSK